MRDKVVVDDVTITVLRGGIELADGFAIQVKVHNLAEPELVAALMLIDLRDYPGVIVGCST